MQPRPHSTMHAGNQYDLILSSGFLAFAEHGGFLEAVEKSGVKIGGVMGTSAGALTGSLYCAGYTPKEVRTCACSSQHTLSRRSSLGGALRPRTARLSCKCIPFLCMHACVHSGGRDPLPGPPLQVPAAREALGGRGALLRCSGGEAEGPPAAHLRGAMIARPAEQKCLPLRDPAWIYVSPSITAAAAGFQGAPSLIPPIRAFSCSSFPMSLFPLFPARTLPSFPTPLSGPATRVCRRGGGPPREAPRDRLGAAAGGRRSLCRHPGAFQGSQHPG
jgi:hypothetical protein